MFCVVQLHRQRALGVSYFTACILLKLAAPTDQPLLSPFPLDPVIGPLLVDPEVDEIPLSEVELLDSKENPLPDEVPDDVELPNIPLNRTGIETGKNVRKVNRKVQEEPQAEVAANP